MEASFERNWPFLFGLVDVSAKHIASFPRRENPKAVATIHFAFRSPAKPEMSRLTSKTYEV